MKGTFQTGAVSAPSRATFLSHCGEKVEELSLLRALLASRERLIFALSSRVGQVGKDYHKVPTQKTPCHLTEKQI